MYKYSNYLSSFIIFSIILVFLSISTLGFKQSNGYESRKLDEVDESKCGGCPCGTTCTPIYPSPPPPPPKKPKTGYCPPPPSSPSSFIYIMGPPGNLYPVDQYYNDAPRSSVAALPAAVCGAVVALFIL